MHAAHLQRSFKEHPPSDDKLASCTGSVHQTGSLHWAAAASEVVKVSMAAGSSLQGHPAPQPLATPRARLAAGASAALEPCSRDRFAI